MTSQETDAGEPVIWRFTDNRPGHLCQSQGLCQAIQALSPHHCIDVPALFALGHWLARRLPASLPPPSLLIGAGHKTHLPMLAARRRAGGRIIVLMQPSLPLSWFDCCILPEHDLPASDGSRRETARRDPGRPESSSGGGVASGDSAHRDPGGAQSSSSRRGRIIASRGALNTLSPTGQQDPDQGLIVIGGPSRHYTWDENGLLTMIEDILRRGPQVHWRISNSRRTPPSTSRRLEALASTGTAHFFSHQNTGPGWLAEALGQAASTWVTQDSASTLCEALSSGTATGLLPVPERRRNKLGRYVQQLLAEDMLRDFATWNRLGTLRPPAPGPLQEATRCARILQQWGWI